ncbi:3-hydroxybenzoate 6-hydroxylase-like [Cucumis melo var. makuwa]|uniref:3-hydroxybenzoate 6-hydroxylase-like n=1 Tax=Cucumis melo var. makuwa TaxID=1194695 RepID=A0A5A7T563_CUCMM|nr:3-hydroxybenzoate 6-hydroxylase-like [Cucumis melo var. makuwa]TYK31094.1 3-hydroxybenzoate 6-hydroxylase-like [Cucumis melo var. makuwa]
MRRETKRIVDGRRDRKPKREVGQRCEWWDGQQASGGGNERMRRTKRTNDGEDEGEASDEAETRRRVRTRAAKTSDEGEDKASKRRVAKEKTKEKTKDRRKRRESESIAIGV